jgi:ABC-2 type transport system ATP-binding protein
LDHPVVEFRGVTKTYAYSHLGRTTYTRGVEDLTLSIADGEAFGLLGLNGSGKTTTFKLAMGLLRPTSGEIRVPAPSRVGYLPELPYFYSFMTPRETLRFYGRLSGIPDRELEGRVERVIGELGLSPHAGKKMSGLSKGLAQRVGLAQAVLHEPALVILDEPVSGLDPLAIREFRESLARLKAKGTTLLVSSHSISEIEKLCDRVGVLKDGRLLTVLTQAQWLNAPGGLEGRFVEAVLA